MSDGLIKALASNPTYSSREIAQRLVSMFDLRKRVRPQYCPCTFFDRRGRFECMGRHTEGVDHHVYAVNSDGKRLLITQPYGHRPEWDAYWREQLGVEVVDAGKEASPYWPGRTECLVLRELPRRYVCLMHMSKHRRLLGSVVVEACDVRHAMAVAGRRNIHPTDMAVVVANEIPSGKVVPPRYRNRLLTERQLKRLIDLVEGLGAGQQ